MADPLILGPAQLSIFDPTPEAIIAGKGVWTTLADTGEVKVEPLEYVVEYTPGPPALGTPTKKTVEATTATVAHDIVKGQHRWVMIHKVYPKEV